MEVGLLETEWKHCIVTDRHVNDYAPKTAGFCTET